VGRDYDWTSRKKLFDAELAALLSDARLEVHVLMAEGVPAGFTELDRRQAALAYPSRIRISSAVQGLDSSACRFNHLKCSSFSTTPHVFHCGGKFFALASYSLSSASKARSSRSVSSTAFPHVRSG
jgi:hypothetical protein